MVIQILKGAAILSGFIFVLALAATNGDLSFANSISLLFSFSVFGVFETAIFYFTIDRLGKSDRKPAVIVGLWREQGFGLAFWYALSFLLYFAILWFLCNDFLTEVVWGRTLLLVCAAFKAISSFYENKYEFLHGAKAHSIKLALTLATTGLGILFTIIFGQGVYAVFFSIGSYNVVSSLIFVSSALRNGRSMVAQSSCHVGRSVGISFAAKVVFSSISGYVLGNYLLISTKSANPAAFSRLSFAFSFSSAVLAVATAKLNSQRIEHTRESTFLTQQGGVAAFLVIGFPFLGAFIVSLATDFFEVVGGMDGGMVSLIGKVPTPDIVVLFLVVNVFSYLSCSEAIRARGSFREPVFYSNFVIALFAVYTTIFCPRWFNSVSFPYFYLAINVLIYSEVRFLGRFRR